MNLFDSIFERRSVRTFNGKKLKEEDLEKIKDFANNVSNPYGISIEWFFLDANTKGLFSAVIVDAPCFIAGKMKVVPHAEEAFGYAFERIVLFAQSLGIGTTWIAGTMNREEFEKAIDLKEDEIMPCISPLGYPSLKMSIREKMMRMGVKAESRIDFEELFFDESFDKPLTKEKAHDLVKTFEGVQKAPSAVNKQPWRIVLLSDKVLFFEKQNKGFVSKSGWDLQKIDLGIALCHFFLGLENLNKDAKLIIEEDIKTIENTKYIATIKFN